MSIKASVTASSSRRAMVLAVAWIAAAALSGVPAGSGSSASADTRGTAAVKIEHSGPECLAGHAAPPAKQKSKRGARD